MINCIKRFWGILLALILVCGTAGYLLFQEAGTVVNAENLANEKEQEEDEKILSYYHKATVDEEFRDNIVNVILESEYKNLSEIGFSDFSVVEQVSHLVSITYGQNTIERGETITLNGEVNPIFVLELGTHDKTVVLQARDLLFGLDMVLVAEPDYIYETVDCLVPSDSYYSKQWGLSGTYGIQAESAWDITMGSTDVKVGVFENAIDMSHEDLSGRVFAGNLSDTSDSTGHGTHVAGIIGAIQNSYGIAGVAEVSMYLLSRGYFVESLSYATENDIQVLNASFRYTNSDGSNASYNSTHYNAIKNYSGLLVCAAGNQDWDLDENLMYPACYDLPNVISVGAIKEDGTRPTVSDWGYDASGNAQGSNYSSSGTYVDIYAPGDLICSTVPTSIVSTGYAYMSGTSMAAPFVTGVAALILSKYPDLTGDQLKGAIISGASTISISTDAGTQTVKRLNAYQAIEYCLNDVHRLFSGGTGLADDPYLISNETQFRNMASATKSVYVTYQGYEQRMTYYYKLINNIELTGDWTPFEYKFSGNFDGNGKYITYSMEITQSDLTTAYQGLFGFVTNGATIKDLELRNCSITTDTSSALTWEQNTPSSVHVGVLAGAVTDGSKLSNIQVTSPTITCNITEAVIGGIVGSVFSSVTDCEVTDCNITSYSGWVGGMAGASEIAYFSGGIVSGSITIKNYDSSTDMIGAVIGTKEETADVDVSGVTLTKEEGKCLAAGTLITLADGTQVPVEELTGEEMLLVWNLETGQYDSAPILFIDSDPAREYEVISLSFSDGTSVKVIYEHGFWDYDLNEYVYLDENAAQYIGHWFMKQTEDEDGFAQERVQLTGVEISTEYTAAYSPVTYGHLCYFVNGMLSMPGGIEGLFNIFEVDAETMAYDQEAMQADIAAYGLYTYEEFSALYDVPEDIFCAFNGQYLKVAMGKGLIDGETLEYLIARYSVYFS